ncbi:type IV pilus biogenesis/stability protein PilW [Chromatium weissei]|nr:type IV pilus biogenesis/stability protein PilW [Chromatium weissei]
MNGHLRRTVVIGGLCVLLAACGSKHGIQKTDEALGLDPEDSPAELYVRMAEEYYNRGQTDVAFRRAQQALEADKKYPRAHVWAAFLYEQIGQAAEAQKHYERAIKLAPNNSDVRHAYGAYECRQKHYAEAEAQFKKAIENPLYTTPWVAMVNAGQCAEQANDVNKATTYYRNALAANAAFGPALLKLAELAHKRGDAAAAKRDLDRYFASDTLRTPATAYSALTLGVTVERQLGNRKRASEYEKMLQKNFSQSAQAHTTSLKSNP